MNEQISDKTELRKLALVGARATFLAQFLALGINVVSIGVLARLLTQADFGLVAMVTVFSGLFLMFRDAGLSSATVQSESLDDVELSNLFWTNVVLSIVIGVLIVASCRLIAAFYGDQRLIGITIAVGISLAIGGLGTQHSAILRRDLRFLECQVASLGGQLLGVTAAIILACYGFGYWALVSQGICTSVGNVTLLWSFSRWIPGRPSQIARSLRHFKFGASILAANFVNYLSAYTDQLLIGRASGPSVLAMYEKGSRLLMMPIRQLNGPITNVTFPVLSRLQDSDQAYRKAYLAAATVTVVGTSPLIALTLVSHDWLVHLWLGRGWEEAAVIAGILACGSFVLPLCSSTGWLFMSQGRVKEQFVYQSCDAVVKIALILVAFPWGVRGIAIACVIRLVLNPFPLFWIVGRSGPVHTLDLWRLMGTNVALVAAGAIGCLLVRAIVGDNPLWGVILSCVFCLAICSIFAMLNPFTRYTLGQLAGTQFLNIRLRKVV